MEFVKYRHMQNIHPDLEEIKHFYHQHPDGAQAEWVATEKIHGANFQFCISPDKQINCCSRNFVLNGSYGFNNYQELLEKYRANVLYVYEQLCEREGPDPLVVRIYGELFGGEYPGYEWNYSSSAKIEAPTANVGDQGACAGACSQEIIVQVPKPTEVRIKPTASGPVQKEVLYIPDLDFYIFEISWAHAAAAVDDPNGKPCYLDIDDLVTLATEAGFIYMAQPLYRGTLGELMKLSPEFSTTVPAVAGLPSLDDNLAEGFVLRPTRSANKRSPFRLKLKSVRFYEFSYAGDKVKPDKKQKAKQASKRPAGKEVNLNETETEMATHLLAGLTRTRLVSLESKYKPTFVKLDDRLVASHLVDDILEEIREDRPDLQDLFADIDKTTVRKLKSAVFFDAAELVERERPTL